VEFSVKYLDIIINNETLARYYLQFKIIFICILNIIKAKFIFLNILTETKDFYKDLSLGLMELEEAFEIVIRYSILLILAFQSLYLIYLVFTPLTVYPVYFILKAIYNATLLEGNVIFFKGVYAELITACIAGAAYYFLLILNLTTPMKIKKRIYSILFILASFLAINIIRIAIFAFLLVRGFEYFDITHKIVWYIGSTILVLAIWFVNVYLFRIKEIPIYSDIKNIVKDVKKKKVSRKDRKKEKNE